MATHLALLGTQGVWMVNGPPQPSTDRVFVGDTAKHVRAIAFSQDGAFFAWSDPSSVHIVDANTFERKTVIVAPRVIYIEFSPSGNIVVTWCHYQVDQKTGQGSPNLNLWDRDTGSLIKGYVQKSQSNWNMQWTSDEELCARIINGDIHFFEKKSFDSIAKKLADQKVQEFSLAPTPAPYHLTTFVPGNKSTPAEVRIFKYPNISCREDAIAHRIMFKAESVTVSWNKTGVGLLILASSEKSDSSYYGEQNLFFANTTTADISIMALEKKGPVYSTSWHPRGHEFCVVYGYMPARVSLFNLKCDELFHFGTGPRNMATYNPWGSILCIAGFGNLQGNIEFWDLKKRKQIIQTKIPDTTQFQWCPDGEHVVAACCAPRLRVGNCYHMVHYTGSVVAREAMPEDHQLHQAVWQNVPPGTYPERAINYTKVPGIEDPKAEAKVGAYRPPQARNRPDSGYQLHQYEAPLNEKQKAAEANKPMSKNKKKREARKAKADQEGKEEGNGEAAAAAPVPSSSASQAVSTGDPEKDKKIRNLRKKLQQIEKLKEDQKAGKTLEKNQLDKIKGEDALLAELETLEI